MHLQWSRVMVLAEAVLHNPTTTGWMSDWEHTTDVALGQADPYFIDPVPPGHWPVKWENVILHNFLSQDWDF